VAQLGTHDLRGPALSFPSADYSTTHDQLINDRPVAALLIAGEASQCKVFRLIGATPRHGQYVIDGPCPGVGPVQIHV
jgi:hypothetical protein